MKNRLRIISFLLCVLTVFSLLAGCNKTSERLNEEEIRTAISDMKQTMESGSYIADYDFVVSIGTISTRGTVRMQSESGTKFKMEVKYDDATAAIANEYGLSFYDEILYAEVKDGKYYTLSYNANDGKYYGYEQIGTRLSAENTLTPETFFPSDTDFGALVSDNEDRYYFTDAMRQRVVADYYERLELMYGEAFLTLVTFAVDSVYVKFSNKKISEIYSDFVLTTAGLPMHITQLLKFNYKNLTVNIPSYTIAGA